MITFEEIDRDPWSTYPVNKDDLYELLLLWESYHDPIVPPDEIKVEHWDENLDGSADVTLIVGRNALRKLASEGFISSLKRTLDESRTD